MVHAVTGTAPAPTPEQEAARHILGHPLVYAMTKDASRPSYIPRERFVSALLGRGSPTRDRLFAAAGSKDPKKVQKAINALPQGELKKQLGDLWTTSENDLTAFRPALEEWYRLAPTMIDRVGALIDDLPDGPIKKAMHSLWIEAGHDAAAFRKEAETWFDQAMQRLSGWYKRRTQAGSGPSGSCSPSRSTSMRSGWPMRSGRIRPCDSCLCIRRSTHHRQGRMRRVS